MAPQKALETIGKTLSYQYERWHARVRQVCSVVCAVTDLLSRLFSLLFNKLKYQAKYKIQLDPTVEEVKKLCCTCRKLAKSERVLFHYNGHGVPKPTANGEIWLFNKVYTLICNLKNK